MHTVILYTIHCPACNVLEKKLRKKEIEFQIVESPEEFRKQHIIDFPVLSVDSGPLMNYTTAVKWVNEWRHW